MINPHGYIQSMLIENPFDHIEFEKVPRKKSDDKAREYDLLGAFK